MKNHTISSERGSVVVYILIAIALFAALSFAVSKMMSGGQVESKGEISKIAASEVLQFGNSLRRAIQTMKINGVSYNTLSFENETVEDYENDDCNSPTCRVFESGGVSYQEPDANWLAPDEKGRPLYGEWYFPAHVCVVNVGTDTGDTCDSDVDDNEEVLVILPWIKRGLCIEINDQLDIENPEGNPPQPADNAWSRSNRRFIGESGDGDAIRLDGMRKSCFEGTPGGWPPAGTYHYFHVLWAR